MEIVSNPDQVKERLQAGNARFLEGKSIQSSESSLRKLKEYAKTPAIPKAIVLCCSDSRAPVEMIFDQDLGDLFVIRVAGNVVAPSLVGSVEFAASTYGTSLVLVMGHTLCGAVTATLNFIEDPSSVSSENLHDIIRRIKPHILPIAKIDSMGHDEKLERSVEANVIASVNELTVSSSLIENLVQGGKLKIIGAVLHLETGAVEFLDI